MSNLIVISDISIRQDAEGRYCLNDLHKAAGGEARHKPGNWLMLGQTKALTAEIETAGIPAIESKQGVTGGTYVCKELVYAYAMWISPSFNLKVIRAYDAMVSQPAIDPMQVLNDPAAMRGLLLTYSEKVIALEATVAEQAPKVEALNRISITDGGMCIISTAKNLQMRPKDLFLWLQANRWIYRRPGGSGWIAYQPRITSGHLQHKVTTVHRSDGSEKVVEQVLVTPKGLAKLALILREHAA